MEFHRVTQGLLVLPRLPAGRSLPGVSARIPWVWVRPSSARAGTSWWEVTLPRWPHRQHPVGASGTEVSHLPLPFPARGWGFTGTTSLFQDLEQIFARGKAAQFQMSSFY